MKLSTVIVVAFAALQAPTVAFADKTHSATPTEILALKQDDCEEKNAKGLRSKGCQESLGKALRSNGENTSKGLRSVNICPFGEMYVEVDIFTDEFPGETSWEVYDRFTGDIYMASGSFTKPNEYYIGEGACVPDHCDVVLAVYDTYGDGLRSMDFETFMDGSYAVYVNQYYDTSLIASSPSNEDFVEEHRSFCPDPSTY